MNERWRTLGEPVRAVIPWDEAEEYIFNDPRNLGIPCVSYPHVNQRGLWFTVDDLDAYLRENTRSTWRPMSRHGRKVVLRSTEAATYLGVTYSQLRRLITEADLSHQKRWEGGRYRFQVRDLDHFIAAHRRRFVAAP